MDFEHFAPARDFFYLAAMFLGAGTGCLLGRFRKNSTRRFRNWSITVALLFFSGMLAAIAISIIYSNGSIFMETSLYPYMGILVLVFVLALRFPRAGGFSFIIIVGIFIVWISCGYLCFPEIKKSDRLRVTRETNGLFHVIPAQNSSGKAFSVLSFKAEGNNQILEFRAFNFAFSRILPIIGGINRGDIAEIRCGDELIYEAPRFSNKLSRSLYLGADAMLAKRHFFSFHEMQAKLDLGKLRPGEGRAVSFDGDKLVFR